MANVADAAVIAAQKAERKMLLKGASPEQVKAINYFIPATGCFAKTVSDDEYKAAVKAMADAVGTYQKALDTIGLDEDELKEIPPVTLYGYEESSYHNTTASGEYLSNLYSVTHLFFSSTQVYMYEIIINTMKKDRKERTEEYFYKDITNFSTTTDSIEARRMVKGCLGSKVVKKSVERRTFTLIVPGDKFSCATYGDIDQQVKAMKNKLREKKM